MAELSLLKALSLIPQHCKLSNNNTKPEVSGKVLSPFTRMLLGPVVHNYGRKGQRKREERGKGVKS